MKRRTEPLEEVKIEAEETEHVEEADEANGSELEEEYNCLSIT